MCEYLMVMAYAPWIRFQAARLMDQLRRTHKPGAESRDLQEWLP